LKKARKGACKALASAEIQQVTNDRLLEVAKTEKQKQGRKKGKDYGSGRVIGIEVIEQREQEARDNAFLRAWKEDFARINLGVFTDSKAKSRKGKEKALEASVSLLDARLFNEPIALSPTKRKRKALDQEIAPRKKSKGLQEKEVEAEQEPEIRTRVGRAIKKTSKVQKRV